MFVLCACVEIAEDFKEPDCLSLIKSGRLNSNMLDGLLEVLFFRLSKRFA